MKKLNYLMILFAAVMISFSASAQINLPAPSPSATFSSKIGLTDVTIKYARPSAKGRVIFGDLVQFGQVWRTGANESTKISFSDEVTIGGNKVPAGEYSLYSIPNKEEWTVILSKNLNLWGSSGYTEADDFVRVKVKPVTLSAPVETFTINIADLNSNTANIELAWEKTSVKFTVETDVDSKVMAQINRVMKNPEASLVNQYYSAASYYFEAGKDLNLATDWINKAISLRPDAYWMVHLKAKIQAKNNDVKGALETAEKGILAAKEGQNNDYVRLNEKLIAELKPAPAPATPAKKKK
jgi:hypothetical protein